MKLSVIDNVYCSLRSPIKNCIIFKRQPCMLNGTIGKYSHTGVRRLYLYMSEDAIYLVYK
jgi:hypothetical protein